MSLTFPVFPKPSMTTTSIGGGGDVEGGKITEPVGGAGGPGLGRTVVAVVVEGR